MHHYKEARGILSAQNGINLYRGCTHGCIYCDSRSNCYHMRHEFEDIEVKINALSLLEQALRRKRQPCMIGSGAMCDPYLPLETEERLTRGSLELIARFGMGGAVLTKSDLILRDMDLICEINSRRKFVAQMTLTTFDEGLCRLVEPNVCTTARRVEVLAKLKESNIPTVVWLCPILPFINDTEENLRSLLAYCDQVGVRGILCFGMGMTLREGNREYFYQQLDEHFPGLKQRYIKRFGQQYSCPSPDQAKLMRIFTDHCEQRGIMYKQEEIFAYLRELDDGQKWQQDTLF